MPKWLKITALTVSVLLLAVIVYFSLNMPIYNLFSIIQ
jgi:hypothetical protein